MEMNHFFRKKLLAFPSLLIFIPFLWVINVLLENTNGQLQQSLALLFFFYIAILVMHWLPRGAIALKSLWKPLLWPYAILTLYLIISVPSLFFIDGIVYRFNNENGSMQGYVIMVYKFAIIVAFQYSAGVTAVVLFCEKITKSTVILTDKFGLFFMFLTGGAVYEKLLAAKSADIVSGYLFIVATASMFAARWLKITLEEYLNKCSLGEEYRGNIIDRTHGFIYDCGASLVVKVGKLIGHCFGRWINGK